MGCSRPRRSPNKERDFVQAHANLIKNYFSGLESVYDENDFEHWFHMPRSVFETIKDTIFGSGLFVQKTIQVTRKPGISPLVHLTACLQYLAYGDAYDREDKNLSILESSMESSVKQFTRLMVEKFGKQYLNRCPTAEEKKCILSINASKGFPGLFASWDCKHFPWKICPMQWTGQYQGHHEGGKRTIIMEAIADCDQYLWYINFGSPGSLNDINVLDKSSIVGAMMCGKLNIKVPEYTINGTSEDWLYFLADGIDPDWAIFVKTFSNALEEEKRFFASKQEAVCKDVKCAFEIIVQQFHVLAQPLRSWYQEDLMNLVNCCVIIHNMVVEARRDNGQEHLELEVQNGVTSTSSLFGGTIQERAQSYGPAAAAAANNALAMDTSQIIVQRVGLLFIRRMESPVKHFKLKSDLIAHVNSFYKG
jgi:hypothetical protein